MSKREIHELVNDTLVKMQKHQDYLLGKSSHYQFGSSPAPVDAMLKDMQSALGAFRYLPTPINTNLKNLRITKQYYKVRESFRQIVVALEEIAKKNYGSSENTEAILLHIGACIKDLEQLNNQLSETKRTKPNLQENQEAEHIHNTSAIPNTASTIHTETSKGQLFDLLMEYFKSVDLEELCLKLGIDYDALPGYDGKKRKILSLIEDVFNKGRIDELKLQIKKMRPNIEL